MPCCRICSGMWAWRTREARRASRARRIPFRLATESSWISWWRLWTPRIHTSFAALFRTRSRREVSWMLTWCCTSSTVTVCWKVGYGSEDPSLFCYVLKLVFVRCNLGCHILLVYFGLFATYSLDRFDLFYYFIVHNKWTIKRKCQIFRFNN